MVTQTTTEDKQERPGKKRRTSPIVFYRQVVGELRKVIWPTRQQLITYTIVTLVFALVMVGIIFGLDWAFGELVLTVFG